MGEILTSVGSVGEIDTNRSAGRAYQTLSEVVVAPDQLLGRLHNLEQAAERSGRRRYVLRAETTRQVAQHLVDQPNLPLEALVPLASINNSSNCIVYLGHNIHPSEVPELTAVEQYWNQPIHNRLLPLERVLAVPEGFRPTTLLSADDSDALHELWRPFGWTRQQIESFISSYAQQSNLWFSGIRCLNSNSLVSACMGESIQFGSTLMVEGTEYSTHPDYEHQGLCAAAVAGLYSQILGDTLYSNGVMPLIIAEFDMTSRSDVVGRKVGMTIPSSEIDGQLRPNQVLRSNVSVLDRRSPNALRWRDLGNLRHHYRDAYRTTYNYWRNFIIGILPRTSVEQYYPQDQVNYINSLLGNQ